jgi:hypothetical protein
MAKVSELDLTEQILVFQSQSLDVKSCPIEPHSLVTDVGTDGDTNNLIGNNLNLTVEAGKRRGS